MRNKHVRTSWQDEDVRMKDHYLYLHSRDSLTLYPKNSPSECWIQLPKPYILDGQWECALVDISLDCSFSPRSLRLYLCCDFVEESCVKDRLVPVLRNIEVNARFNKIKTELFPELVYIPVNEKQLHTIRLYLLDADLKPVVFTENDLHCVLHLKQTWAP